MRLLRSLALALCVVGWSVLPAWAEILFDAAAISPDNEASASTSWSHPTGAGADRVLLVCTQSRDPVAADTAVSTLTYDGVALTKIRDDLRTGTGTFIRTEWWYLIAPASGTKTIALTFAGVPSEYGVGASLTLSGVHQSSPIDTHGGASGLGTLASASVATTVAGSWLADCAVSRDDAGGLSVGAGQSIRNNRIVGVTEGTNDGAGLSTVNGKSPAGSVTMTWTQGTSSDWVTSVVAVAPATVQAGSTISIVQTSPPCQGNNTAAVCTFAATPQAGNTILLLVALTEYDGVQNTCAATRSIADPQGANHYNLAVESPLYSESRASIWFRRLATQPSGTFAISMLCASGASDDHLVMAAIEVAGLLPSLTVHDTSGWAGGVNAASVTPTGFAVMAQADELAVTVVATNPPSSTAFAISAGWTKQFEVSTCAYAATNCAAGATKILSAIGTASTVWTFNAAPLGSAAVLATFRQDSASGGSGGGAIITRTLAWIDTANNETSFRIQKRTDQTYPNWVDVVTGMPPNTQSATATIQATETGDCWRVIAENSAGQGISREACPALDVPVIVPPPPSVLQIGGMQSLLDDELL